MEKRINSVLEEQIENLKMLKSSNYAEKLVNIVNILHNCIENGGKILICGNGGSAADAQHFAAELVGRFKLERKGLPAIALTTDTSVLTCMGNDYGYDSIFSRQVEALGNKGDVLIGISTSGNSKNVILAVEEAKKQDLISIGLLGKNGGKLKNMVDEDITFNYSETARIQEHHLMTYHLICEFVEQLEYQKEEKEKVKVRGN